MSKAKELLEKYGDHLGACYKNHQMGDCNCGFDQALAALDEQPCQQCGAGASCVYSERGISQWARDCADNNYKHYKPKCPECGRSGWMWANFGKPGPHKIPCPRGCPKPEQDETPELVKELQQLARKAKEPKPFKHIDCEGCIYLDKACLPDANGYCAGKKVAKPEPKCEFALPICPKCQGAGCKACKSCAIHYRCYKNNAEMMGCPHYIHAYLQKPEPSGELVKELREAASGFTSYAGRDKGDELPRTCETPMCKILIRAAAHIEQLEKRAKRADECIVAFEEATGGLPNAKRQTERIEQLVEERDLAIAHDRQPYPTADAYKRVCEAYHKAKETIKQLEAKKKDCKDCVPLNKRKKEFEKLEAEKAKAELLIAFYLEGLEKSGEELIKLKMKICELEVEKAEQAKRIEVLELAADLTQYTKEQLTENEQLRADNKTKAERIAGLLRALDEIITESSEVDKNNWPIKQKICLNIAQQAKKGE